MVRQDYVSNTLLKRINNNSSVCVPFPPEHLEYCRIDFFFLHPLPPSPPYTRLSFANRVFQNKKINYFYYFRRTLGLRWVLFSRTFIVSIYYYVDDDESVLEQAQRRRIPRVCNPAAAAIFRIIFVKRMFVMFIVTLSLL